MTFLEIFCSYCVEMFQLNVMSIIIQIYGGNASELCILWCPCIIISQGFSFLGHVSDTVFNRETKY